jgi:hypothetical protein
MEGNTRIATPRQVEASEVSGTGTGTGTGGGHALSPQAAMRTECAHANNHRHTTLAVRCMPTALAPLRDTASTAQRKGAACVATIRGKYPSFWQHASSSQQNRTDGTFTLLAAQTARHARAHTHRHKVA